MKRFTKWAIAAAMVSFASLAHADPVAVPVGSYIGSCSVSNGCVDATNGWTTENFTVSWNITAPGAPGQPFHYIYSFSGSLDDLTKQLSHILLELSPSITGDNFSTIITNFTSDGGTLTTPPTTYQPTSGGTNPNMPGNLYGIKLDNVSTGGVTFSFDSTRNPIWGDFYAKDGNNCPPQCLPGDPAEVTAWNVGFGTDPAAIPNPAIPLTHIPTPDTTDGVPPPPPPPPPPGVPFPPTLLLAGLGAGLLALRRLS